MLMVRHANSLERPETLLDAPKLLVGVLETIDTSVMPNVTTGYLDRLCPVINDCANRISESALVTLQRSLAKGRSQPNLSAWIERKALHRHGCALTASRALLAWA